MLRHLKRAPIVAFNMTPDWVLPLARRGFYTLYPNTSWAMYKQKDVTTEAFVSRFFDGEAEYEAYEEEFVSGPIKDCLVNAYEEMDGNEEFYDVHKADCIRYYALVRKYKPETIVETGVFHGVSTLALLTALEMNDRGRLYSIDCSPFLTEEDLPNFERKRPSCAQKGSHRLPPGKGPGWIIPDGYSDRWELRLGWSRDELPGLLDELGEIDMFLHDSEHSVSGMLFEFELAWDRLVPGGFLLSHHVGWNDAFETFARERATDAERGQVAHHYKYFDKHEGAGWGEYLRKPVVERAPESATRRANGSKRSTVRRT
jgi:predicted O-methyltransferase YrrM